MNYQMVFSMLVGLGMGVTALNLPPVLDSLMTLYGVSYGGISILLGAVLWSHALMQIPGGMVSDRLGLKPTLLLGLSLVAVGHLLPTLAPDLALAVVGRVIVGLGTGLSFITTLKLIALYAPGGRGGVYQSYFGGLNAVGGILVYLLLPRLVVFDWRWTFFIPAALTLAALAMIPALKLEPVSAGPEERLPLNRIVLIKVAWVIGIYHALSWGVIINLGQWVPSVLAEVWHRPSAEELAWGGALVLLISGVGRLSGGAALSRFSAAGIANGSILILTFTFLGLFLFQTPWLVLALMLVAGWFTSINFGAFFQLAGQTVPPRSMATVFGFVNFLANLGAVLFTFAFGLAKDGTGSFRWGFAFLTVVALTALLGGWRVLAQEKGTS